MQIYIYYILIVLNTLHYICGSFIGLWFEPWLKIIICTKWDDILADESTLHVKMVVLFQIFGIEIGKTIDCRKLWFHGKSFFFKGTYFVNECQWVFFIAMLEYWRKSTVSNILFFHNIWDNPSHWLSYFSRWLKPPTRYYKLQLDNENVASGTPGDVKFSVFVATDSVWEIARPSFFHNHSFMRIYL